MSVRVIDRWQMGRFFARARRSPTAELSENALEDFAVRVGPELAGEFAARWLDGLERGQSRTPTVLCLYRLQFGKDIAELKKRTSLRWVPFKAGPISAARFLGRIQKGWVPTPIRAQTEFMIAEGAEAEKARELTLRFGRSFLQTARKLGRVDAVMSANVDYWQEDGILRACNELGIPFLVLCREMAVQPIVFDGLVDYYRKKGFRFMGTAAALGAQRQSDALVEAGVCRPDQVALTGLPRFDVWRDIHVEAANGLRRMTTLVSFSDPRYGAAGEFEQLLGLFAEEAENSGPGSVFVVKCKDRADADACRAILGGRCSPKLVFEVERPVLEIYARSGLVIGFNSTALVEAVLSGAKVAVPAWGSALVPPRGCLVSSEDPLARRVIRFAADLEEVRTLARQSARGELSPDPEALRLSRDYFRQFYFFPEEGSCSLSVENFVRRWIGADQ